MSGGYIIELSFNFLKHGNVEELKDYIHELALVYFCSDFYTMDEMICHDKIQHKRTHRIVVCHFLGTEDFTQFIKVVKKIKEIYIECIYEDRHVCKLIYASSEYLKNSTRDSVLKYKTFRRERSYSEEENMILSAIDKLQVMNASSVLVASEIEKLIKYDESKSNV